MELLFQCCFDPTILFHGRSVPLLECSQRCTLTPRSCLTALNFFHRDIISSSLSATILLFLSFFYFHLGYLTQILNLVLRPYFVLLWEHFCMAFISDFPLPSSHNVAENRYPFFNGVPFIYVSCTQHNATCIFSPAWLHYVHWCLSWIFSESYLANSQIFFHRSLADNWKFIVWILCYVVSMDSSHAAKWLSHLPAILAMDQSLC